ncbi:hypothetical protein ZIOFF_022801 [Zingiber officinale]|uniref:Uncharacterized protein n=1 Tax=Zingiber officinale TaxID=94328 RepID=A0A8J5H5Q3_ZINOF|nr:hypothetical protein ZIOFF_022801 [Zingiber officinale]
MALWTSPLRPIPFGSRWSESSSRIRALSSDVPVPDFLSSDWAEGRWEWGCGCAVELVGVASIRHIATVAEEIRAADIVDGEQRERYLWLDGSWFPLLSLRLQSRKKRPFGPKLEFSAEEAIQCQIDALKYNDQPRPDYGIEVMYRFAGFDPFERSTYFGPFFDLGQFERFRRIFHHPTYRVLLAHKERSILSNLWVKENRFKQRVWIRGSRPEEEEIFEFTMVQRIGGSWDGYWLTESLLHDGDGFSGGLAY